MVDGSAFDREAEYDRREEPGAPETRVSATASGTAIVAAVVLAGTWLLVEPFHFEMTTANAWNDFVVGLVLVALGGYSYHRRANGRPASVSAGLFVAVLGLWLVAAPYSFGTEPGVADTTAPAFWNDVVIGVLVFLLGAYSTYGARETDVARPARQ